MERRNSYYPTAEVTVLQLLFKCDICDGDTCHLSPILQREDRRKIVRLH